MEFSHKELFPDSLESARLIIPFVTEATGTPERVVDLGGGTGAWCRAFREAGSAVVTCIDDPNVMRTELHVDENEFTPHDLSGSLPNPIDCDLAVSLEVAEHLPPALAPDIVGFLTKSAPLVLFSASRPGQPGRGHINEQPARYWSELFAAAKYTELDLVRPRIIKDKAIPYWYRQNIMLYANEEKTEVLAKQTNSYDGIPDDFELVSERLLKIYRKQPSPLSLRQLIREIPNAAFRSVRARYNRRKKPS